MALLTSRGALLVLSLLVGSPAAAVGQDPLPGKPSDPPALRIPPQSLNSEQATDQERAGDAASDRESAEGGAVEKIREMLQGEGEPEHTGDPILDGVLDLLRNRGSVLDGSPLDPQSEEQPEDRPETREPTPLPEGNLWVPYVDGDGRPGLENRSAGDASRFLLAEQLLKTARLLAAQAHGDARRQGLVEDLRSEAARCLAAEPRSLPSHRRVPSGNPPPAGKPVPAGHSESY